MTPQMPPPLNCPGCGSNMSPKDLDGTPVFMCTDCGDFFMKRDTFTEVVGVTINDHVHDSSGDVHECPGCKGQMSGADVMGVEVDYCPHCQIVVSDRASFSHVIEDYEGPKERSKDLGNLMLQMDVARNVDNVQKHHSEAEGLEGLKVEDIFVLYRSGILMSSITTNIDETLDKDVLGSMMMAITDFVQQSFKPAPGGKGKKAKLSSIRLEEKEIAFEHGEFIVVAMGLSGSLPSSARKKVADTIKRIETENKDILCDWDGDLGKVKDIGLIFRDMVMS